MSLSREQYNAQAAAFDLIDEALDNWKNQTMCPQAHVVDVLLDIRRLLSNG